MNYNHQSEAVNIYFLGPGIWDNGIADSSPSTAMIIGGGTVTNSDGTSSPVISTRMLSHEMGHCLGLYHTVYGGDCEPFEDQSQCDYTSNPCACGDHVNDTSYDPSCTGCHIDQSCNYVYNPNCLPSDEYVALVTPPPLDNIMTRSPQNCRLVFTPGQARRMKARLNCDPMPDVLETETIKVAGGISIEYDISTNACMPDIIIESGSKLTVETTLSMDEGKKILVKTGARLLVNGGTLTGCDGNTWKGLEIEGNPSLPTSPLSNQGYAVFSNGAAFERAETSIKVHGGGVVRATSTDFTNCGGADFSPYSKSNTSFFSNCNFLFDESVPDNSDFHVRLDGVKGTSFTGCSFSTKNTSGSLMGTGTGISSTGSTFYVYQSKFFGFEVGISASGSMGSPRTFFVDRSNFASNETGILSLGVNNFSITNDTFHLGTTPFSSAGSTATGISASNCSGYRIESNLFMGRPGSLAYDVGALMENSGGGANFINGNHYDYLSVANQAQGDNKGDFAGLQYWCDVNFGNNLRDFFVADSGNGIWTSQGNGLATRDTFSHNGELAYSDFQNEIGSISFYHRSFGIETPEIAFGIAPFEVTDFNPCPQDVSDGGGDDNLTGTEEEQVKQAYTDSRVGFISEKADWLDLIDGGDTESLLEDITNATINDAGALRTNLLTISPYLSSAALEAVIGRDNIFNAQSRSEILTANPDELRHPALRDLITSEFSSGMADTILSHTGTATSRTTRENLIASHRTEMHRNANLLIRDLLSDTLGYETDTLLKWLENKSSLESDYAIVAVYMDEGDTAAAFQKLDDIPGNHNLTEKQADEHGLYRGLAEFWVGLQEEETSLRDLDSIQLAYLTDHADNSTGLAAALAQGILNAFYSAHYLVVPKLPSGGGSEPFLLPPTIGFKPAANTSSVTAFPNPAHHSVTFDWHLHDETEEAVITIADLSGKEIERIKIGGQKGSMVWKTDKAESGVYMYRVVFPNGRSEVARLALIK